MRTPPTNRAYELSVVVLLWLTGLSAAQTPILDLATTRPQFNDYFEQLRFQNAPYGQYRMRPADSSPSNYASLDAVLSRTIMGEDFSSSLTETQRTEWIAHIQSFALPNGTYGDTFGHHQLHANGMTVGGLGPLGGRQKYPVDSLYAPFDTPAEVPDYLQNNINWTSQWSQSHKFWGGFHMFSQSSRATPEWTDAVFNWLNTNLDTSTGWWIIGQQPSSSTQGLGGGAHIWPLYEHLGRPFPEPERVIDRILEMQDGAGRFDGRGFGSYLNLDALYGLKYMRTQAPDYRAADIEEAVVLHGQFAADQFPGFFNNGPTAHSVLAAVGTMGLLNQLIPERFPDSTGAQWSDIFTDQRLYQTDAVETFTFPEPDPPLGQDRPSNYFRIVMEDAPVAYWRLGQTGGGTAVNAMGDDMLSGSYSGLGEGSGPGNLGQPGPRPSEGYHGMSPDNRAVHLNGTNSLVTVLDQSALDITGALTLEGWIRLDQQPVSNAGIAAKYEGAGSQRAYLMYVEANNDTGALGMVISPDGTFTGATDLTTDEPLPIGQWLHVAATFQPDQFMRLYVNGELVEELTNNVPDRVFNSDASLWIGSQFSLSSSNHLPGIVDEIAVYDRALSSSDILSHYQAAFVRAAGDYNGDGVVSAADYVVWRDSLGQAVSAGTGADGDGNGVVQQADYDLWMAHFGPNSDLTGSSPVPEPGPLTTAMAALIYRSGRKKREAGGESTEVRSFSAASVGLRPRILRPRILIRTPAAAGGRAK